ncbi:MAG TPA: tetratricopeptide repeat protein [Bryobacteraceae bacterium]|jgi:tetratricopeptide (TPR) repeat protein
MIVPGTRNQWFSDRIVIAGLVLSVLVVYIQALGFDFFNLDDGLYVFQNPVVQSGLRPASIAVAFNSVVSSNWQPVTLLSHMLDVRLLGLHSGLFHLVNALIHAASSVLLFVLLRRATKARAASAFVALLFAVHPLHVESVAWISERKDVLSAFFFFLGLYAYILYCERPQLRAYLLVLGAFTLGLLSKPMLVTFPFVLLLFDCWPLRRFRFPAVLWEKIPMFALSAVGSVIAYRIQQGSGAMASKPLGERTGKALLSYITYLKQTIWPFKLAAFYPYPQSIHTPAVIAAAVFLLTVSVAVILTWRNYPYLAAGWFWYLGTLVPVIGLVQVGYQSHADRYMYIPMVGLSMMLAWGGADLVEHWPGARLAVSGAAVLFLGLCLGLGFMQAGYWQNSETVWRHAIEVTNDNWLAYGNLASYLMELPDRGVEAMDSLQAALRIRPEYPEAENNLGRYLARAGLCNAALPHFEAALREKSNLVQADNNAAMCLSKMGDYSAVRTHLEHALRVQPNYAEAHLNLAVALSKMGGHDQDAVGHYETALRLDPAPDASNALAHRSLGELLSRLGRTQDAIEHLQAAQAIQADPATAQSIEHLIEALGNK